MPTRVLVLGLLALFVAGSASAAHPKPKLVRVVRHAGAFTATLTYVQRGDSDSTHVTLRVRRWGTLVLSRKICPLVPFGFAHCEWMAGPSGPSLSVARVGPGGRPAFLVNAWNGGAHCCTDTFIAIPGRTVAWLTREWSGRKGDGGARVERRNGHHVFVTHDGRFLGAFSWPAGAAAPIRVFAIRRSGSFANVTKHFPGLIRAEVRRFTTPFGHRVTARTLLRRYGSGVFAAWCADKYLLGHGASCSRVLAWAVKRHWPKRIGAEVPNRAFARDLNRQLKRWGYKR